MSLQATWTGSSETAYLLTHFLRLCCDFTFFSLSVDFYVRVDFAGFMAVQVFRFCVLMCCHIDIINEYDIRGQTRGLGTKPGSGDPSPPAGSWGRDEVKIWGRSTQKLTCVYRFIVIEFRHLHFLPLPTLFPIFPGTFLVGFTQIPRLTMANQSNSSLLNTDRRSVLQTV